jgi:hypothetical protein
MKIKYLFITFSLILSSLVQSQTLDWAPVGAKWYFEESYFGNSDIGYVQIESVKYTLINNHLSKMLTLNKRTYELIAPFYMDSVLYTYQSNDTIYLYNPFANAFRPIYINNKNIGDSIIINWEMNDGMNNTIICHYKFVIDSIKYVNMNTINLRKIYLHDKSNFIPLKYIENMSTTGIFTLLYFKCSSVIIDGTFYRFRCFYHPIYGLFKFSVEDCDYATNVTHYNPEESMVFYSNNYLFINIPQKYFPINIKVTDILGKEYARFKVENSNESKIHLDIPSQKFYILQIFSDNSYYQTNLKIIK